MGQFINKKKIKMNKLICILICILLISLSVVSVSAQDYFYTNISDYVNVLNSVYGQLSNANVTDYFISSLSSGYSNAFDDLVSYYNIDTTFISFVICSYNSGSYGVRIVCSTRPGNAGYVANWSSTTAVPYFYQYFPNGTVITVYNGSYNGSQTVNMTSSSSQSTGGQYAPLNNSRGWFRGVMPYKTTISPNSNYVDFYYLNSYNVIYVNNGGGSGGGGDVNVGDIGDVDWTNFAAMWAGFLFNNYKFTANNTTYNSDWDSIGFDLTYLARCAMNPTLATITIDNTSYPNYFNKLYVELSAINTNTSVSAIALAGILSELDLNANGNNFAKDIHAFLYDIDYQNLKTAAAVEALANVYASTEEVAARQKAAENQAEVVNEFIDSNGDGSVSASNLGELADSSAEIKSNFNTGYSASGVWDVFDRNWDWFSNTTKNNLEPPAQNVRSVEDYDTPFLDNAINEILRLRGN